MKHTDADIKMYLESHGRPWDAFFSHHDALIAFRDEAGQMFFLSIDDEHLAAAAIKLLTREGRTGPDYDSLNALAMRLRRVTSRPPSICLELLRPLPESERVRYVEHYESTRLSLLIDPIELDPDVMPILAMVRERAKQLRNEGQFGCGMGGGGRLHVWVKGELANTHGVRWRTPQEMNPDVAFD